MDLERRILGHVVKAVQESVEAQEALLVALCRETYSKRSKRAATDKADKPASKKARTGPSPAVAAPQVPSCTLWAFC